MSIKWNHLIAATILSLMLTMMGGAPMPAILAGIALAWGWNIIQALRKRSS